ncbi:uncharacterized protein LOC141632970 [Silene latifolia]|uniref:uncharacterized protein LOC141632970 n=1 Tax=Silene latifolia TaxID=37657 RepID=UPI003D76D5EB
MEFFLGQIKVDYALTGTVALENSGRDYVQDHKTCRGMLLHYKNPALYTIYGKYKTAKYMWEALQTKYGSDDFGTKKYVCSRWLSFKIADNTPVLDQVHKYKNLCAEVTAEGSNQVHGTRYNANFKRESKREFKDCYTCGKPGHSSRFCPQGFSPNGKRKFVKSQAHLVESDDIIVAVVSAINLVSNISEWVVDTRATRHICSSKEMFKDYLALSTGECVFMGNSSTVKVLGKGKSLIR